MAIDALAEWDHRGAQAKFKAARKLDELADRCEKVVEQITKRLKGEKITDWLISLWDPDARPIRKGKLSTPNQFGYVDQLSRSPPTPSPAPAGSSCHLPAVSATRPRTRCCPTPPSSSSDWASSCGR